jgi:WD40 repeat protein
MKNASKTIIVLYLISTIAVMPALDARNDLQIYQESIIEKPKASTAVAVVMLLVLAVTGLGLASISQGQQEITFAVLDSELRVFNISTNSTEWTYDAGENVISVATSDDANYIALGTENWIRFFNQSSPIPNIPVWNYSTSEVVDSIAISANGSYIIASVRSGLVSTLFFFNNTVPGGAKLPLWIYNVGNVVGSVDISANGENIIAPSNNNNIYLFNKSYSGNKLPKWSYNTSAKVTHASISADGSYIAVGGTSNVSLLDNQKTLLWNFPAPDRVTDLRLSANGNYLAVCTDIPDRSLHLFGTSSNIPLWSFKHSTPGDPMRCVDISADGSYIVSGSSQSGSLYAFTKNSSTPFFTDPGQVNVSSVSITGNGKYFAAFDNNDDTLTVFYNDMTSDGNGDNGGPPDGEVIPFGNYFLIIAAICLISVVLKQKKKLHLK